MADGSPSTTPCNTIWLSTEAFVLRDCLLPRRLEDSFECPHVNSSVSDAEKSDAFILKVKLKSLWIRMDCGIRSDDAFDL